MNIVALVGYLFVCAFYPLALYKTYTTRSVDDYNPKSLWALAIGLALILPTTIYFGIWAYIIGTTISFVCAVALLAMYYYYKDPN